MAANTTPTPNVLTNPGFLFAAPLGTAVPANTVAGSIFTDAWAAAWVKIGATSEGSEFGYSVSTEAIQVAEFKTPIRYEATEASGSWAFACADYTASKLKMAYNGGVGVIAPTSGTGATALYTVEPPALGNEVRIMIGWESSDGTVRRIAYQTLQGGDASTAHRKAPDLALLPVTFNLETPTSGVAVSTYFAGSARA